MGSPPGDGLFWFSSFMVGLGPSEGFDPGADTVPGIGGDGWELELNLEKHTAQARTRELLYPLFP